MLKLLLEFDAHKIDARRIDAHELYPSLEKVKCLSSIYFSFLRFTFGSIMGQTQDFLVLKNKLNSMDEKDDALLSKVDVITGKEKILEALLLELEAKQQWNLIESAVILILIIGLGVVVCSSIISIFRKFVKESEFLEKIS